MCTCMGGHATGWGRPRLGTRQGTHTYRPVCVHVRGARVCEAGGLALQRPRSFSRQCPAAHPSASSSSFPLCLAPSAPIQRSSPGLRLRGAWTPRVHKIGNPVAWASLSFPIYKRHLAGNGWNQVPLRALCSSALLCTDRKRRSRQKDWFKGPHQPATAALPLCPRPPLENEDPSDPRRADDGEEEEEAADTVAASILPASHQRGPWRGDLSCGNNRGTFRLL